MANFMGSCMVVLVVLHLIWELRVLRRFPIDKAISTGKICRRRPPFVRALGDRFIHRLMADTRSVCSAARATRMSIPDVRGVRTLVLSYENSISTLY